MRCVRCALCVCTSPGQLEAKLPLPSIFHLNSAAPGKMTQGQGRGSDGVDCMQSAARYDAISRAATPRYALPGIILL